MHPRLGSGRAPGGARNEDEELEELLREQATFAKSSKPAAAKIVRPPPKAGPPLPAAEPAAQLGASEDGGKGEALGSKRPASLFKQLRQGQVEGRPFGSRLAAPHPEIASLPDPEGEELPCLAETVAERPGVDADAAQGKGGGPGGADGPWSAPVAGFPIPSHRSVGKFLGRAQKASSGAGARQAELDAEEEEEAPDPADEAAEIDLQNRRALSRATPEEIHEWQQQLLQQFGAATCEFLQRRGREKAERAAAASRGRSPHRGEGGEAAGGAEVQGPTDASASEAPSAASATLLGLSLHHDGGADLSAEELGFGTAPHLDSVDALRALAGGCVDRHELQKLQWTMPAGEPDVEAVVEDASLPPEPLGKVVQLLRFDLEGRVCLREPLGQGSDAAQGLPESPDGPPPPTASAGTSEGLHHHGAESSQAGYTLAELLLLARSTSMPQRALALRTLACVLELCRVPTAVAQLAADPALERAAALSASAAQWLVRAGFGTGLCVFFWHGVARSDLPKHLAEALLDVALPVQVAALRGVAALFGESPGGPERREVVRGTAVPPPAAQYRGGVCETAFADAFYVARELIWPDAPPPCAAVLAWRARVAVRTPEGGGGGTASWPQLLRRQLLGAPAEAEVTAADVLEPLLPLAADAEEERQLPTQLPAAVARCLPALQEDKALAALALKAVTAACLWSSAACLSTLGACSAHRGAWLAAAAGPAAARGGGGAAELRLQALRLMRCSCEVGGRAAAAWWLGGDLAPTEGADRERWSATSAVRRAIFGVVAASEGQRPPKGQDEAGDRLADEQCAVEGVRIWLAWLRCGAGVDAPDSFAGAFATFWHQLAAERGRGEAGGVEGRWLVGALLLRFAAELAAGPAQGDASDASIPPLLNPERAAADHACGANCAGAAAQVAQPLAAAIAGAASDECAGVPEQLCLAALADFLAESLHEAKCAEAARALVAAQPPGTVVPDPSEGGGGDDDEAPWPLGGGAHGPRLWKLARLRALRSLCSLAAKLAEPSAAPWLRDVAAGVARIASSLADVTAAADVQEALVGPAQLDPLAALQAAALAALAACAAPAPGGGPAAAQLLALASSWPTARAAYACLGLHLGDAAAEAVARAAFRPAAPWAALRDDAEGRAARAAGRAPQATTGPLLPRPAALGPASLSFAAAPLWALACGPPPEAAAELLEALGRPEAAALSAAAPPWLPFVAFAALLSAPLGGGGGGGEGGGDGGAGGSWAWSDPRVRALLPAFVAVHLRPRDPTRWLAGRGDWLSEVLRGLCDRLAAIFAQDSFGDEVVAATLWAFAAAAMPAECRAVCWGLQDPAVLVLLNRVLVVQREALGEDHRLLLWPLQAYLGPPNEPADVVEHAFRLLGVRPEEAGGAPGAPATAWPSVLAAHHHACHSGARSPLAAFCDDGPPTGASFLDELE